MGEMAFEPCRTKVRDGELLFKFETSLPQLKAGSLGMKVEIEFNKLNRVRLEWIPGLAADEITQD